MNDSKYAKKLEKLQLQVFNYFLHETNPSNGLVRDKNAPDWPASISATGLALTSYPVAIERGFISREKASEIVLATLRFFRNSRHGSEPEATGYHGFYYHFLDMYTGRRARLSELSFIDSSILLAGILTAGTYFNDNNPKEAEIRNLSEELYRKADWHWALGNGPLMNYGWKPETGFMKYPSKGYDEAMLSYILGLGSPTFSLSSYNYDEWTSSYEWIESYGYEFLYAGSLFDHQLPHIWIDFRGIRDNFMKERHIDYFENSSRATLVQQQYAIENPKKFEGYNKNCWGISLSDGPGHSIKQVRGEDRQFFGFTERGVPFGPDDGTISPWSSVISLPFAPEIVMRAIDYFMSEPDLNILNAYGFKGSFNATYPHKSTSPSGWKSPWNFGIIEGPALPMIENYRTGFIWNLMKNNPHILHGLKNAGFEGAWLDEKSVKMVTVNMAQR